MDVKIWLLDVNSDGLEKFNQSQSKPWTTRILLHPSPCMEKPIASVSSLALLSMLAHFHLTEHSL